MAIAYENKRIAFSAVVYEDETIGLRDYLQNNAGESLEFDFSECNDLHFSILQLVMAYKKIYSCKYEFAQEEKFYEKLLKGFYADDDICG